MNEKYVGFWKSLSPFNPLPGEKRFTDLPIANSSIINSNDLDYIIAKLNTIEQSKANITEYLGFSTCRICDCPNGSIEYRYKGFRWPSGYKHYLQMHKVAGDIEFIAMIRDD